ncbi:hypothetical protein, partial [Serratia sp. Se-RSmG]|uniref:hypothetical protein n=1 Tax=Serratia sp. Se-RSmG TaxID=3043307 RepID=UPI0024AFEFA8
LTTASTITRCSNDAVAIGTLSRAHAGQHVAAPVIIEDKVVSVVVEHPSALMLAASLAPATQPKPEQVCEVAIGRSRLKLSGYLAPIMLATLVRELKRGRR